MKLIREGLVAAAKGQVVKGGIRESDQRRLEIAKSAREFPHELVDALAERTRRAGATVVDARQLGPPTPNRDLG